MATKLTAIPGGAGAVVSPATEPYPFTPDYERQVVALCCVSRDFYSRLGAHLDPKSLKAPEAINLIKACKAIAEDTGEGPSNGTAAIQRLRTWREDGKITYEDVMAAVEYLDAAEDEGLLDREEVIKEVARIIRKRNKKELTKKVIDVTTRDGDFTKLADEFRALDRIGQSKATLGEGLHDDILDAIVAENSAARFPTGCLELDSLINGGMPKGYTLFIGREKSGKSMVLTSVAAEALWNGKNVALATLELSVSQQFGRLMANLCELPQRLVETNAEATRHRYHQIRDRLGRLKVMKFAPDTPVAEVTRWVEALAVEWGKVDLLVVDYADLLGAGKPATKESSDYKDAKVVGNMLRDHAINNQYVCISAAQGRRGSGASKPLDMDDVADSQHKVRIADLVIAMRMDLESKDLIDWYIALARNGRDRIGTGELPADRDRARMFPIAREQPWG